MENGQKLKPFCLPDAENREICLKDFSGKWIVLYFYPKDNTSGCTQEALDFSLMEKKFAEKECVIIGISPDPPASHQKFIKKHSLTVYLLSDPEKKILEEYGLWQKKKMYGKEYYGVIRTTFLVDPSGNVVHVWDKVKVPGHSQEVFRKLISLQESN